MVSSRSYIYQNLLKTKVCQILCGVWDTAEHTTDAPPPLRKAHFNTFLPLCSMTPELVLAKPFPPKWCLDSHLSLLRHNMSSCPTGPRVLHLCTPAPSIDRGPYLIKRPQTLGSNKPGSESQLCMIQDRLIFESFGLSLGLIISRSLHFSLI